MWTLVTHIVFKYRLPFILLIAGITAFMGYKAQEVEWSFDFAKAVPAHHPDMIYFEAFKQKFGEDGNILVIGLQDSAIFRLDNFRKFKYLTDDISGMKGVQAVLALPSIQRLVKDTKSKKFALERVFQDFPEDQATLDILLEKVMDLRFYSGQIINEDNGATIMLISIQKEILDSRNRDVLVNDIIRSGKYFSENTGITLHYSGLPFVRSVVTTKVGNELQMFLLFSVLITGLIMFLFFRSGTAVIFPMIIIGVIVIWVMGTLALLGYKVTLLTGLLPPIIVVIGIPNSVYLLNKYHQEYETHGNKTLALSRVVRKIGLVTLITNVTTAIGFGVLVFIDILILQEFGLVASLNIMATFLVSIILIPAVFSYLPPPNTRQLRHLKFKPTGKLLTAFDLLVHRHRYSIFAAFTVIVIISSFGVSKLYSVSYLVDDIPDNSSIMKDLRFFEDNFSGVMPLEIVVDTGKRKGAMRIKNLEKVDELETFLGELQYISKPVSLASFVKAARQAFYNENPARYGLPNNQDKNFIFRYITEDRESAEGELLSPFMDSTSQTLRVSLKVADIGSIRMDSLITLVVEPGIQRIFAGTDINVTLTGTTLLFIKGNRFLIENLRNSFLLAFFLIAIIMAILFRSFKMIIMSLIPNVIPLLMTAGLMGFFNIPLKPSTALIFSIAFGISVDYSIHLLAKYRMELYANNFFVPVAVSNSIREMGSSMVYTSIILFAGFIIFSFSEFGGTIALGILTSCTLFIAMFTNLILLPAMLLTFDSGKRKKGSHPIIEQYDEFYHEEDDEEIDLTRLQTGKNGLGVDEILEKKD